VYAGSSSAYGNNPQMPKVEDMATAPLSPYAISKLAGEMYCQVCHDLYGLETVVLRYFNVFGPRQDPASEYAAVIPRFITKALRGEPFTIYGDGGQSRDFTFVDNVVSANLLACEAPAAAAGQVINAACGDSISLNELAGLIMEITGSNSPIQYEEARAGDVRHSHADISKAKELLNYAPKVSFREGLEKVIAWYKADMGL
jgi:nucleoside-diphosphate-sugar epimerase